MKLLRVLLLCTAIVNGGAEQNSDYSATLSLKGQTIPSNGTGVVIFYDIGGYLGPEDGLLCTTTFFSNESDFTARYWSYPNGTLITQLPSINVFGVDTCHFVLGVSLYYSGLPKERGLFQCTMNASSSLSIHVSVFIVDMSITGPTIEWPDELAIAGEDVELFINVTTSPDNVPVPYQWMLNGIKLLADTKHQGTQSSTLTIFDVQDGDKGNYTCQVAHSASGTKVKSTRLTVVTIGVMVNGIPSNPSTGKSLTLTCVLSGTDILKDAEPEYQFCWKKDEKLVYESASTPNYTFDYLKSSDAGNYRCLSTVTFKRKNTRATANVTSPQYPLLFSVLVYRIYLYTKADCYQWTNANVDTMNARERDIKNKLIQGIKDECSEIQVKNDTTLIIDNNQAFGCPKNPKNTIVYSAQLHGDEHANTSRLVDCLDNWIKRSKYIVITDFDFSINHICSGVVNDEDSDFECGTGNWLTSKDKLAIGLGVACFVLIVAVIVLIIHAVYVRKGNRCGYNNIGARGQR